MLFISDAFTKLASLEAKVKGLPDIRLITFPHPLGGNTDEEVRRKADLASALILPLIVA